jgi:hypothetical protein
MEDRFSMLVLNRVDSTCPGLMDMIHPAYLKKGGKMEEKMPPFS